MHDHLEDVQVERPMPGGAVVTFTGEHDLATKDAVEALLGSLIEESDHVVVDVSAAEFVDSSMIHILFKADRAARLRGSTFRLQIGTAPIVRKALELGGLLEQLDCASTREEALRNEAGTRSEHRQSPGIELEGNRNAWNIPTPSPQHIRESSAQSQIDTHEQSPGR